LKTINGIVGSILVILGVLSLAGSMIVVFLIATFFVLLLVGVAFLIAGAVVLFKGRQKGATMSKAVAPEAESPRTTPASPVVYCRQCGRQNPSGSLFCNQCGSRL